jgi:enamine deaminase RidA (YjgF/YER057c/UK114 family)
MTLIDANPDGLPALPGVVTHVVTVPELGLVYTSGQVAWDKDGNLVGEGDYAAQAEQIVCNLDIALTSAGATRDDLIKQTIFVVDYRPEIVPLIMGPLHTGTRRCAAGSLVGVQARFAHGYLIEIEAVARIPGRYLARGVRQQSPGSPASRSRLRKASHPGAMWSARLIPTAGELLDPPPVAEGLPVSTFHLTHCARDRADGLPLEFVVAKLTARNAELYGPPAGQN